MWRVGRGSLACNDLFSCLIAESSRLQGAAEKRDEAWESLDEDARQLILEAIRAGDDEDGSGLAEHLRGTDEPRADESSREAQGDDALRGGSASAAAAEQSSAAGMDEGSDEVSGGDMEDEDEDEPQETDDDVLDGEPVRPEAVQAVMSHSSAWGRIIR